MADRKRINFSLVMTNEGLQNNARSKIAFLTDIRPSQVKPREVRELAPYTHKISILPSQGERVRYLAEKYIGNIPKENPFSPRRSARAKREFDEKNQAFTQHAEMFSDD